MAKARGGEAEPKPIIQRYLIPAVFDNHYPEPEDIEPFLCGCYQCHPEFWCQTCIVNREKVLSGSMKFEEAGLYGTAGNPQPDSVRLRSGVPAFKNCRWHRHRDQQRFGAKPLTMPEALAVRAGVDPQKVLKGI